MERPLEQLTTATVHSTASRLTSLLKVAALVVPLVACAAYVIMKPRQTHASNAVALAREEATHLSAGFEEKCQGDKNLSTLKVKLRVLDGKIRLSRELSANALEASDLFKCRAKPGQRFEKKLLEDLDAALLRLPRFYLQFLTNEGRAELLTFLPPGQRDELIPFLTTRERTRFFVYLPDEEQLQVISDLTLDQRKEFFAYLPEEVQKKVLEGLPAAEQETLRARKKQEPPLTPAPANETLRLAVAEYPGTGKKAEDEGSWTRFVQVYDAWQATGPHPEPMVRALNSFLTQNLSEKQLRNTAILGFDPESPIVDSVNGELTLQVTDPIGDLSNPGDYQIVVPPVLQGTTDSDFIAPSAETVISLLQPLKGQLWERQRIATYINDYFIRNRTGYERDSLDTRDPLAYNQMFVSTAAAEPKCLLVRPVPQIARIVFLGELKDSDIKSALRPLLTDTNLRFYRENPRILTKCEDKAPDADAPGSATADGDTGISVKCQQISFKDLVGEEASTLSYLNLQNWRLQQPALAQAGFLSRLNSFEPRRPKPEAGEGETGDEPEAEGEDAEEDDEACEKIVPLFVEIRIVKGSASDESLLKEANPSPTPTPASTFAPQAESSPTPTPVESPGTAPPDTDPRNKNSGIQKPKRNMIGAEVVYRPDQGVRVYGQYAHSRPGQDDFSVSFGGDGGLLAVGDYEGVDLFRGRFERQFPFVVRSYSDSVASRIFSNLKMDERRSGAAFRVTTELRSNPTLLSLSFEARHETVQLADNVAVVSKQNVSSLTFGGTYSASSRGVGFRRVWQFEPTVRLGLGVSDQPRFSVLHLGGRLHQFLPNQFDLIFDGRFDLASKRTPIFDQPSFGSSETVRGFRADDAIGLRLWALKNEFAMPVPGTSPDSTGLLRFLREQLKLAVFLDAGGVYQTTGSKPGMRFGPGAGLRFNYRGAELQFDWAYGLGDAAVGRGRGRFYFSVSREISRFIKQ